jgi:hypothetical protein
MESEGPILPSFNRSLLRRGRQLWAICRFAWVSVEQGKIRWQCRIIVPNCSARHGLGFIEWFQVVTVFAGFLNNWGQLFYSLEACPQSRLSYFAEIKFDSFAQRVPKRWARSCEVVFGMLRGDE